MLSKRKLSKGEKSGALTGQATGPSANCLENVDSEMQSPAYQNEKVRHLAAAISLARLAEEHLPTSMITTKGRNFRHLALIKLK
jgi:hypothetical protein